MKIAVIAADGRLGRKFVEEALISGHIIHAGVRGNSGLSPHPNLKIVNCDVTNIDELRNLIADQEVVVSTIGHVKGSEPNIQTIATENIISVMNDINATRFVDVTGTGVRFPDDKIPLFDHVLNTALKIVDPSRIKDGQDHQQLLKASKLEWTTIRVLKLQNIKSSPFELKLHGPTKLYVSREEVAKALLQVIEQSNFIKQAPILTKV